MELLQSRGWMGVYDNYLSILNSSVSFAPIMKECLQFYFNSIVYGFEYIYENYRENVVPLSRMLIILFIDGAGNTSFPYMWCNKYVVRHKNNTSKAPARKVPKSIFLLPESMLRNVRK